MDWILLGLGELMVVEVVILLVLLIFSRRRKREVKLVSEPVREHRTKVVVKSTEDYAKNKIKQKSKKFSLSLPKFKEWRAEQYVIALIYFTVFIFAAYLAVGHFMPDKMPLLQKEYTIKAADLQVFDKLNSFYIDNPDVLGDKIKIDGKTVRPIVSAEPFSIVFAPKIPLVNGTKGKLDITLVGTGTDVYLNDKMIFPGLTGYSLLKQVGDYYVYVNDSVRNYTSNIMVSTDNPLEYIQQTLPGATIYSLTPINATVPILSDYKKSNSVVPYKIRDNIKFATYAEGDLNIRFTKQDINMYAGRDEYNVTVTDYNGKVYYIKILEDDGDTTLSNRAGKEQDFSINLKGLARNVYYVTFTKDKYNSGADSTIKSFTVNSNKLLIIGNFLPWESAEWYTKVTLPKKVGLYYWWKDKNQTVSVSGTEDYTLKLDEEWFNTRYDSSLSIGDYNFIAQKGFLWVYSDYSSYSRGNWFDMPYNMQTTPRGVAFIIISKSLMPTNNSFVHSQDINLNGQPVKFAIKAINEDRTNLESVKLRL